MQPFWEIVASNALLAVALAAGVALLGRVWKNPWYLHLLWLLVLLKLVTPPVLTVPIAMPAGQTAPAAEAGDADEPPAYPSRVETSRHPTISTAIDGQRRRVSDAGAAARIASDTPYREIDWLTIGLWTWGGGVVLFATRLAWRIGRFRQLLRGAEVPPSAVLGMAEGIAKRLGLRQTPEIRMLPVRISPLVWSLDGRPRVFLPADLLARLDQSAQAAILAHELAHVRRKDHWVRLLEVVITTLFWWHPVVWWAARRLQELEDQCCDAMVLNMAPQGARTYATALLDTLDFLSACPVVAPLGATVVQSSTLLARRISMLNQHVPTMRLTAGRLLLLATVAFVPMALAFAAKPPEEPQRYFAMNDAAPAKPRRGEPKASERAVAAALNWLSRHQTPQGNWSIDYREQCKNESCSGAGLARSDTAATAMALLPFLAAGQTHQSKGVYRETVAKGIAWLIKQQKPSGDLSGGCERPLYAHGLAMIALGETYGMTHDEQVGNAARLGVGYIERAQNEATGGWGSVPGEAGDTSLFGWQVMALKSAQLAGLPVKASVLSSAERWLRSVAKGEHLGFYSNQPGGEATPAMTAVGMLARQYLGASPQTPGLAEGKRCLSQNLPDNKLGRNTCYWYYGIQAMHGFADADYDAWSRKLRRALIETQVKQGCAAGSWDPEKPTPDLGDKNGGRLLTTSLSTLCLEVYYRYLPLFKATAVVASSGRADASPEQAKAIAEIRKLGGKVTVDEKSPAKPVIGVDLSRTEATDAALEYLKGLAELQTLDLRGTRVTDAGLVHLKGLTRLERLFLTSKVTDAGLEHLKELTNLRLLFLVNARVTDAGLKRLTGFTNLQWRWLYLNKTEVSDAGLAHLEGVATLQWLLLANTKVTDAGLEHLKGLTKLQLLDLNDTKVSDAGLVYLEGLTNLQTLDLKGTEVTDAGLGRLEGLTKLQRLELGDTNVGDAGLVHLKGLTNLQWLDLRHTKITDAGLEHLQGLTTLQDLLLGNTEVTDAGLEHLKRLDQLRGLNMEGSKITYTGVKRLQQTLPKCKPFTFGKASKPAD